MRIHVLLTLILGLMQATPTSFPLFFRIEHESFFLAVREITASFVLEIEKIGVALKELHKIDDDVKTNYDMFREHDYPVYSFEESTDRSIPYIIARLHSKIFSKKFEVEVDVFKDLDPDSKSDAKDSKKTFKAALVNSTDLAMVDLPHELVFCPEYQTLVMRFNRFSYSGDKVTLGVMLNCRTEEQTPEEDERVLLYSVKKQEALEILYTTSTL